jgi:16S rRNA (cytidine1402-2'-O)-methyltransferase
MSEQKPSGKLFLVPTPIGNLGDMTIRAIETLKSVDFILAEDTRNAMRLLKHFEINTPLQAHHAFNEHRAADHIISKLKSNAQIALISDAGTPGISDPGFLLVRACKAANVKVECLPGATAMIPAVVASGIPCNNFYFEGFLPHKKGRQTRLKTLAQLPFTFIIYESPFRLVKCLEELILHCGQDRICSVSREISKIHDSHQYGTLAENLAYFQQHADEVRGEIVIVVGGLEK